MEEFLSQLGSLQPIIMDIRLVDCLLNVSLCARVEESRLIRFALPPEQWKRVRHVKNELHLIFEINSARFVVSKMIPVHQYFIIPGLHLFSLETRHIPGAKLAQCSFGSQNVLVMENLDLLRRFLKNSFVECRKDLAQKIRMENPELYEEKNVVIQDPYIKTLHAFTEFSYSIGVYPMLTDGTLLGWYRECGFIPHTTDIDVTVFASEIGYNEFRKYQSIKKTLPDCTWDRKYGFLNESGHQYLQLVFWCAGVKLDFFVFYNNKNITWQGGRGVRWVFPLIKENDVCTADMLGYLFFVPCKVTDVLAANYGPDWHIIHHSSKYFWDKSPKNIKKI